MSAESSLKLTIQEAMKTAMKAQDKERLGVIRLMMAAFKQIEVDERIVLDDARVLAILDKMQKQRRDSIAEFQKANRTDLIAQEEFEMGIIQSFLPTPLSDSELEALIKEAIQATGAATIKDMGKVMGLVKPKAQGRADMTQVSNKIKTLLDA